MASALAHAPAGTVTAVFPDSAEREGAFRWLSNPEVESGSVTGALCASTLARCQGTVYCAVDGATLSLVDHAGSRDIGAMGAWKDHGRGLYALTSLAVDRQGTPIGVCEVQWWARTQRRKRRKGKQHKALCGETARTIALLNRIEDAWATQAPGARLWYQFDRGFDDGRSFSSRATATC